MNYTPAEIADEVWIYGTRTVDGLAPSPSSGTILDDIAYAVWTYPTRTASGGGGYALTATGIYTGAPTTGKPSISQVHILTATGIKTGAPTTGKPVFAQVHALTALGIVTGAPTTGKPALTVPPSLVALGIYVAPIVGKPAFTSPLSLVARGITVTPIMAKAYMPRIGITFGQSVQGRAWVSHTEAYILQGGQWRALQELKIETGRAWHDIIN